jgi:hypothetical protein
MLKSGGYGFLTASKGTYGYTVTVGKRKFADIMEVCS